MYIQNKSEPGFCSHWSYQLNFSKHRILKWLSHNSILKAYTLTETAFVGAECQMQVGFFLSENTTARSRAVTFPCCGHLLSPLCSQPSQEALQVNLYLISTTLRSGRTKGQTGCLGAEPVLLQHGLF